MSEEQDAVKRTTIKKKKTLAEALSTKKRRTSKMKITIDGTEYDWTFRALSGAEADALRAKHPATPEQKKKNAMAVLNLDTYHPEFLSACSESPSLSVEEAHDLLNNENFSAGELESILGECYRVNNEGLGIPFTDND